MTNDNGTPVHTDALIQQARRDAELAIERLEAAWWRTHFPDAPAGQFGPEDVQ